jgi:UDP-4-amino-4,6-dideoxy-N-acetyl-beta-L-altrosamine N-acetyltransferase
MKNRLAIRRMQKDDLDLVLEWRNCPGVRCNMISNHIISKAEHSAWYEKKSVDDNYRLLIATKNHVRFGFVQIKINQTEKIGEWGFYRDPLRNKGSGTELAKLAINYAFVDLDLHELWGFVLKKNIRSINFHKKNGFTVCYAGPNLKIKFDETEDLVKFCLRRDRWV